MWRECVCLIIGSSGPILYGDNEILDFIKGEKLTTTIFPKKGPLTSLDILLSIYH